MLTCDQRVSLLACNRGLESLRTACTLPFCKLAYTLSFCILACTLSSCMRLSPLCVVIMYASVAFVCCHHVCVCRLCVLSSCMRLSPLPPPALSVAPCRLVTAQPPLATAVTAGPSVRPYRVSRRYRRRGRTRKRAYTSTYTYTYTYAYTYTYTYTPSNSAASWARSLSTRCMSLASCHQIILLLSSFFCHLFVCLDSLLPSVLLSWFSCLLIVLVLIKCLRSDKDDCLMFSSDKDDCLMFS